MNINEILSIVYNSPATTRSAKHITGGKEFYVDLISELIIALSEMDIDHLNDLHNRNKLNDYCYKIMYFQYINPNKSFYKNYRIFDSQDASRFDIEEEDEDIDGKYQALVQSMSAVEKRISRTRYPTEYRMLEAYLEHKTFRETGKKIGISFITIQFGVKRILKEIRKEYDSTYHSKANDRINLSQTDSPV